MVSIVLLGMQGSGKGTQAQLLAKKYQIQHISTGDIFRDNIKNKTILGQKVEAFLKKGELVPDALTIAIIEDTLKKCEKGFILDGFPRNLEQTKALDTVAAIDLAINLQITDKEAIKRLSGRRTCSQCNAVFHIETNPPKKKDVCDKCNGRLIQRDDDKEDAIKNRIAIYKTNIQPILDYYIEKDVLFTVDATKRIDYVFEEMCDVIDALG